MVHQSNHTSNATTLVTVKTIDFFTVFAGGCIRCTRALCPVWQEYKQEDPCGTLLRSHTDMLTYSGIVEVFTIHPHRTPNVDRFNGLSFGLLRTQSSNGLDDKFARKSSSSIIWHHVFGSTYVSSFVCAKKIVKFSLVGYAIVLVSWFPWHWKRTSLSLSTNGIVPVKKLLCKEIVSKSSKSRHLVLTQKKYFCENT